MPVTIGSIVRLKSGGPEMTVADASDAAPDKLAVFTEPTEFCGAVTCWWFTPAGDIREKQFPVDLLDEVNT